jgi:hypothetical protein
MLLDKLLQLSAAQDITDTDAYSTNTVDLGNPTVKRRVGAGEDLALIVVVTTAAAGDSASFTDTFDFIAVESVNANLSSHTVMAQRRIPASELVAGAVFEIPIPKDKPAKRYIGARYELGSGDTVSVSAYFIPRDMVQAFVAYAKGYAV